MGVFNQSERLAVPRSTAAVFRFATGTDRQFVVFRADPGVLRTDGL